MLDGDRRLGLPGMQGMPTFLPSLRWNYTRRTQSGSGARQGGRRALTPAPSPGGPPVLSTFHKLLSPRGSGPCSGKLRSYVSGWGKSLCEKPPEGPSAGEEHCPIRGMKESL